MADETTDVKPDPKPKGPEKGSLAEVQEALPSILTRLTDLRDGLIVTNGADGMVANRLTSAINSLRHALKGN